MSKHQAFDTEEARSIGREIGIDFNKVDLDEFRYGLEVELEHGTHDRETNITNDDPFITGKIAWAHLKELPDYYTRLALMEAGGRLPNKSTHKKAAPLAGLSE